MWLDSSLICIIFLGVYLLGVSRVGTIIQVFALQSLILSTIPLQIEWAHINKYVLTVAAGTLLIKVFIMPNFLFWAIRHVNIRREAQIILGYAKTMLLGIFLIGVAFYISSKVQVPQKGISNLLMPTAFSIFAIGILLLVSRVKAITQVIGFLVMENGVFLISLLLLDKTPLIVEMGILLDIFVAVLVMGIVVNQINEEYEDTNTLKLTTLRD